MKTRSRRTIYKDLEAARKVLDNTKCNCVMKESTEEVLPHFHMANCDVHVATMAVSKLFLEYTMAVERSFPNRAKRFLARFEMPRYTNLDIVAISVITVAAAWHHWWIAGSLTVCHAIYMIKRPRRGDD